MSGSRFFLNTRVDDEKQGVNLTYVFQNPVPIDGGVFVPSRIQIFTKDNLENIFNLSFQDLIICILKVYEEDFTNDIFSSLLKDVDKFEEIGYEYRFSDSSNFGLTIFQIAYHFWNYSNLVKNNTIPIWKDLVLVIPSENFENGIAAFYAMQMGLPIKKIVFSFKEEDSNLNFFATGEYNINSGKKLSSFDLERVLFHIFGKHRTTELMNYLESEGFFRLSYIELNKIKNYFDSYYLTQWLNLLNYNNYYSDFWYFI